MPYTITTRDGITIQNISDNVPPDSPELKARVEQARGLSSQSTRPGLDQRIRGSAIGSFLQALRDPIDAGAQMLVRSVPDRVRQLVDDAGNYLASKGLPVAYYSGVDGVDALVTRTEREHQAARQATGHGDDIDWARIVGGVVNPANLTIARAFPIAAGMGLGGKALAGAAAGAAGGMLQPVVGADEGESFAATKAVQTGLGAVAGAVITPALSRLGEAVAARVGRWAGNPKSTAHNVDALLAQALQDSGQTVADVPPPVLHSLRTQVADALRRGKKPDAAALLRQADADAVGVRLTQGQLSRDPTQFAAERNLRGVAGVGEPLMQRFEQQNQRMTGLLNDDLGAGRASEAYSAGERLLGTLRGVDSRMKSNVDELYRAARGSDGRYAPLDARGFSERANQALDEGMLGHYLPSEVRGMLNDVSGGKIPLNVNTLVQLDSVLSAAQRHAGRGSPSALAIGKVRDALHATDLLQSTATGIVPRATTAPGTQVGPRSDDIIGEYTRIPAGQDTREMFSAARKAAAERFGQHEAIPALKAAANDEVAADDFVRKFVLNAKTDEAKKLAAMLSRTDKGAFEEARSQIGAALARAAFGENAAGDRIVSPERLNRAIRTMGSEKLRAFFTPDEVNRIHALGRVAAYINAAPTTAPVNSSNTSAAMFNLMRAIPGMPSALAIGSNLVGPVRNARVVDAALSEQVPHVAADLPPEVLRLLGPLTTAGGVASGGFAALPLR